MQRITLAFGKSKMTWGQYLPNAGEREKMSTTLSTKMDTNPPLGEVSEDDVSLTEALSFSKQMEGDISTVEFVKACKIVSDIDHLSKQNESKICFFAQMLETWSESMRKGFDEQWIECRLDMLKDAFEDKDPPGVIYDGLRVPLALVLQGKPMYISSPKEERALAYIIHHTIGYDVFGCPGKCADPDLISISQSASQKTKLAVNRAIDKQLEMLNKPKVRLSTRTKRAGQKTQELGKAVEVNNPGPGKTGHKMGKAQAKGNYKVVN